MLKILLLALLASSSGVGAQITTGDGGSGTTATTDGEPVRLAEKAYSIANDNCGEYLVPPNQTHALVYEQELVYTYTANGDVRSYQYTDRLQLPVYCLRCK
jgi:alpha-acetolactate decarboxylase